MGLSSSKQKQTNEPSAYARPYITAGADTLNSAYSQASPIASQVSSTLGAQLPGLAERAFTPSAGINAATGYNTSVLGGKYLDAGNPYLAAQIAQTNADVGNTVQARFGAAGRTGSNANQYALGRALSANETGLRYADYGAERDRMASAASLAPTLENAQYSGLAAYLSAANAATGAVLDPASQYAGGLGSLLGGYNTTTSKTSPSLGAILAQIGSNAAKAYAGGG